MPPFKPFCILSLFIVPLACLVPLVAKANGGDFDSPAKTFAKFQAAAKQSDYEAMVDCFSPAGQKNLAASIYGIACIQAIVEGRDNPDSEYRKTLAAFCAEHGIEMLELGFNAGIESNEDLQKHLQKKLDPVKDIRVFVVGLLKIQDEAQTAQQQPKMKWGGELTDVKIMGDRANAKLNGLFSVTLEKKEGEWKFVELFGAP